MQATSTAEQTISSNGGIIGNWKTFGASSRIPDATGEVEQDSTSEGRSSKRLQRSSTIENMTSRPSEPTPAASRRQDPFPTPATRRRQSSFREQRALPISTNLKTSPSKRLVYNGISNPRIAQQINPPRMSQEGQPNTFIPTYTHTALSSRDVSRSSELTDFLPSVNFDELHSSIGSADTDIKSFPTPNKDPQAMEDLTSAAPLVTHRPLIGGPSKTADSLDLKYRIGLNGSSLRRHNSNAQQAQQTANSSDGMIPPSNPMPSRVRRKTYFPPTNPSALAQVPATRAPRKSIGPGILTMDLGGTSNPHRRPTLAQAGMGEAADASDAVNSATRRNVSDNHMERSEGTNRQNKTKSLQPPPRKILVPEQFFTPTGTPEQYNASPIDTNRSPGRPNTRGTMTPSSSKRISIMPSTAYATGLGARTISPTDARRLKRMSMMPNPPPMPFTPPTPQPDPPFASGHPTASSPSLIPRKSVTPSSSRTTPDLNRKSYSSGISNSSTTSYNSVLASSGSLRISQSQSASRLPTLKTRSDNVPIGDDEVVPPVPAIPKAYESPKGDFEHPPFFSNRKSSLGYDVTSLNSTSAFGEVPSPIEAEPLKIDHRSEQVVDNRPQQYRSHHVGVEPTTEKKPDSGANGGNRRTLQPLRLPPLNLLPLSTPTASKIAALHEASALRNEEIVTPPPKLASKITPTTPMTASKASFSKNFHDQDKAALPTQIRSSSSHYNIRPEALSYRATSGASSTAPNLPDPSASRPAISPFTSCSLPKSSGDFGHLRLEKSSTFESGADVRPVKLTGPRLQKPRKASKDDASSMETASPVDASTHSLGNSIRRKLSLTRKRSISKAQTASERDPEPPPKPPKHNDMPPPKLPASATWSGPLLASPTPLQQSREIRTTRVASNSSASVQPDPLRNNFWSSAGAPKREPTSIENVGAPKRTARAALEGAPDRNALSLKDFLKEAKTMELTLDRDDLSAEDEMKKLASKRKETEAAAKEVDALRRRATPRERVGPSSALRMAQLNIFERGEIVDYKDVYFCGTKDAKKHVGDLSTEVANFGYDDDRGDYNVVTGDHLSYRYEIIDILGKGSFGQVVRCIDHKSGVLVAIKIIRNKKRFHQQALVEVEILQKLREWDPTNKHSMVNFVQSFYFRGHLCISTELLGMNLYEFIKCHDFRGFSLKLIRRFAKQLLSSLVLLKSKKVIHCDLKPENVLLAHPTRSEIKVIDFGSSCLENEKVYTYIQSRFYRSPEVILGMTYGMPIDMWSLGCILAELLTGYPIFPGENEQEQLACIMEVFGPPEKHLIEKSTRKKLFFDSLGKPRITVSTKGKRRRPSSKSLQQALKCEDEVFLDFITRCLRWDPDRRLKPDDAVHHEFITGKITKNNSRPRAALANATSSPIKRYNSISQTPASIRPLPQPPVTSFKNVTSSNTRDLPNNTQSPSKSANASAGPKRHSTMTAVQSNGAGAGIKRTLNGVTVHGSALPRVTSAPRVSMGGGAAGGKSVDLAAAAAVVSLQKTK